MYCTGGIRCDVYSTFLKQRGFRRLYSLQGGVQSYLETEGPEHWRGSLYVFDERMAVDASHLGGPEDEAARAAMPAATPCAVCGAPPQLPHINCANVDCNLLFLACGGCQARLQGCCCEDCRDNAPRLLRPAKEGAECGVACGNIILHEKPMHSRGTGGVLTHPVYSWGAGHCACEACFGAFNQDVARVLLRLPPQNHLHPNSSVHGRADAPRFVQVWTHGRGWATMSHRSRSNCCEKIRHRSVLRGWRARALAGESASHSGGSSSLGKRRSAKQRLLMQWRRQHGGVRSLRTPWRLSEDHFAVLAETCCVLCHR